MYKSNFNKQLVHFLLFLCTSIVHTTHTLNFYSEYIQSFHSDITIHDDASMTVVETISAWNTGRDIRRGIVREFPTHYKDNWGNNVVIGFSIQQILEDGKPTPYTTERVSNGIEVHIGGDHLLKTHTIHTYEITYTTNRQIGFFDKHDELYWNVTGNGWIFPIKRASARITFPKIIPKTDIQTTGYTGRYGNEDKNYRVIYDEKDGTLLFETTKPLSPYSGLTIVTGFPQGIVTKPRSFQKFIWFIQDNIYLILFILGLIIFIIFHIWIWRKIKAYHATETVIPLFYPPENISPSAARYITKKAYDATAFSAEIVNMAVHGFLIIDAKKSWFGSYNYSLLKKDPQPDTYDFEYHTGIMQKLFSGNKTDININNNQTKIRSAFNYLEKKMKAFSLLFDLKLPYIFSSILMLLFLVILPLTLHAPAIRETIVPILFFSVLFWRMFLTNIFTLYTPKGKKIKSQIDGFKMYLKTAESERMKIIGTPPDKTPELFETYLPYAIALGVEQAWTKQFSSVFKQLELQGTPYRPMWHHGARFNALHANAFVSNFNNSFTQSISSSATPPGSRSGLSGGGGGFSGGGGGGGGGRGR